MLTDEADGVTYPVLIDHVVERTVAATLDDLGDIFRVGAETGHKQIDGDVLLGEDVLFGEYVVEALTQLVVAFCRKSRQGGAASFA